MIVDQSTDRRECLRIESRVDRDVNRPALVRVAQAAAHDFSVDPKDIASDVHDWDTLAEDAEANQLTPLVHACLNNGRRGPPEAMRQLEAIALRHQAWHRARTAALTEILQAFDRVSIRALALKGAALAWMIYPSPVLRPMNDLDLLVAPSDASAAQAALGRLGFRPEQTARRFERRAHHLPIARRSTGGLAVNVEIHVDALPRDTLSSIALANLTEPAQRFSLDGAPASTLGHVDTLRHLTHHVLEPSWDGRIRLLGLIDLFRYAATCHDQIDWPRLEADYPFVLNALSCFHHVCSLPPALNRFAPSSAAPVPDRIGESMRPLRSILVRRRPIAGVLSDLLDPPGWWLHAYYGVAPERSLAGVRCVRHPWRLARWCALRIGGL
jgi:Uncharacterised nucleotidyltransferase